MLVGFLVVVERYFTGFEGFLKLSESEWCGEKAVFNHWYPLLGCKAFGPFAVEHDVRRIHNQSAEADGVFDAAQTANGSCFAFAAFHEGGIEFMSTVAGKHGAFAGVEQFTRFKGGHGFNHRIECRAAVFEDGGTRKEGIVQRAAVGGFFFRSHCCTEEGSRSSVQGNAVQLCFAHRPTVTVAESTRFPA